MRAVVALCLLLASSGCLSGASQKAGDLASAGVPGGSSPGDPAGAPVDKPYAFQGSLTPAACAPSGPSSCLGIGVAGSKGSNAPEDARVKHAKLTLTWTPAAPTMDTLQFSIVRAISCGQGCWEGKPAAPPVAGKSPLALDVEVPAMGKDEFPLVVVREASSTPDPVAAWAHPEQPFKVDGTLTVLPMAREH